MSADSLEIERILEENKARWERLQANYNPVTGEGLAELLGEKRVLLKISDFAIPEQWVPEEMMSNKLVKQVAKAGSIEKFIKTKKWANDVPSFLEIERRLRRIRHKYDFCHWAYFCIKIKPKKKKKGQKGKIPFKLNYPQLTVLAACEHMRKMGVPIDIIILKARQWGGSTFCFFYQIWIMFHWDHDHSFAIAAHIQTASETILLMLKKAIETYPAWDLGLDDDSTLKLSQVGSTGHMYAIKDQDDRQVIEGLIFIGTAENPDTLRSKDIAGAHFSEVGLYKDTPKKKATDLIADIQEGIVDAPLSMEVMESTAKSTEDFFHETWMNSSDTIGGGGYYRIFVPWMKNINDIKPIQELRTFAEWLLANKDRDITDGKWRDTGKYYWWLWEQGATLEGINWYRFRRLKTPFDKMCNEAPTTAEQAFIAAGKHVFDPFEVAWMADRVSEPMYVGDLVSNGRTGADVLINIQFVPNMDGYLRVWEKPDDSPISDRYVVAVDIGGPNDTSDFSVIRVMDRLMMMPEFGLNAKPNIVAEMRYHTDHDLLAYDAMRVAKWYNNALLVIESNTLETRDQNRDTGGDGSEYILDIVADIYPNLYMRHNKEEDVADKTTGKYGFHTNVSTKPKIIDHMKTCLRDKLWIEPSHFVTDEMSIYIEDDKKLTAPVGKHDDCVLSTAILLWVAFKEMEVPKWIDTNELIYDKVESDSNIVAL